MKLKELEKRLKQEPGNLGLRVQVAGLLRETGRSIEAVEHYRTVALAYRDQGRTQQAIAVCRSILEIAPEDAACQGLLAMLQGRTAPAPSMAVPIIDELAERSQKTPSVPPIASRASTSSSGPVSVPSVPSLRPPTPRPTEPPPVEEWARPAHPTSPPIARPTPDERPLARTTDPIRRSSIDETPLPQPMPYHLADRTSQPSKISAGDLMLPLVEGADTRPGHEERRSEATTTTGLAQAARRISGLLDSKGVPIQEMDLSAELDTRQRARIPPEQLEKIEMLPATPPLDAPVASFIDRLDLDDLTTPPPGEDLETAQVRQLTPIPRGSEDALTPPPLASPRRGTPSVPPPANLRPPPSNLRPVVPAPNARPASPHRPASPTSQPTMRPASPTSQPSMRPASPTSQPSMRPASPTSQPNLRPTSPTSQPNLRPTSPTSQPSMRPASPTSQPNLRPTSQPAMRPASPISQQGLRPTSPTSQQGLRPTSPTSQQGLRPTSPTSQPISSPNLPRPSVPAPAKRPTPSVPSLADRATPAMPLAAPVKRPTPSVPPLTRGASTVPPATRPTPHLPRPTPTSLPPPPSSGGPPSRPSLVAVIPPKGASSRSSITIETRGPSSNPPTDVDEELTQPRDRMGLDDDED